MDHRRVVIIKTTKTKVHRQLSLPQSCWCVHRWSPGVARGQRSLHWHQGFRFVHPGWQRTWWLWQQCCFTMETALVVAWDVVITFICILLLHKCACYICISRRCRHAAVPGTGSGPIQPYDKYRYSCQQHPPILKETTSCSDKHGEHKQGNVSIHWCLQGRRFLTCLSCLSLLFTHLRTCLFTGDDVARWWFKIQKTLLFCHKNINATKM